MNVKVTKFSVLLFVIMLNCDKRLVDYRNKFCGTYNFVYTELSWTLNHGAFPAVKGTHSGKVYYDKKGKKDEILVNFKADEVLALIIERQGKVTGCGKSGQFEKNNLVTFVYETSNCTGAGRGGGVNYTVHGTKH